MYSNSPSLQTVSTQRSARTFPLSCCLVCVSRISDHAVFQTSVPTRPQALQGTAITPPQAAPRATGKGKPSPPPRRCSSVRTLRPQVTPGPPSPRPVPSPPCCPLQKVIERSKLLFLIPRQSVSNKITFGYFLLYRKRGWVLKCFYGSCRRPQSCKHMTTEYLYES